MKVKKNEICKNNSVMSMALMITILTIVILVTMMTMTTMMTILTILTMMRIAASHSEFEVGGYLTRCVAPHRSLWKANH